MKLVAVDLEQIVAGPKPTRLIAAAVHLKAEMNELGDFMPIKCRAIGDVTGGDVYVPANSLEAGWIEGLRRAKWRKPVQVEIVR